MGHGIPYIFLILLSQTSGKQRVDTDAQTRAESDHQTLNREGQRYGRQSILAEPRDKDTVHHII